MENTNDNLMILRLIISGLLLIGGAAFAMIPSDKGGPDE